MDMTLERCINCDTSWSSNTGLYGVDFWTYKELNGALLAMGFKDKIKVYSCSFWDMDYASRFPVFNRAKVYAGKGQQKKNH